MDVLLPRHRGSSSSSSSRNSNIMMKAMCVKLKKYSLFPCETIHLRKNKDFSHCPLFLGIKRANFLLGIFLGNSHCTWHKTRQLGILLGIFWNRKLNTNTQQTTHTHTRTQHTHTHTHTITIITILSQQPKFKGILLLCYGCGGGRGREGFNNSCSSDCDGSGGSKLKNHDNESWFLK